MGRCRSAGLPAHQSKPRVERPGQESERAGGRIAQPLLDLPEQILEDWNDQQLQLSLGPAIGQGFVHLDLRAQ